MYTLFSAVTLPISFSYRHLQKSKLFTTTINIGLSIIDFLKIGTVKMCSYSSNEEGLVMDTSSSLELCLQREYVIVKSNFPHLSQQAALRLSYERQRRQSSS